MECNFVRSDIKEDKKGRTNRHTDISFYYYIRCMYLGKTEIKLCLTSFGWKLFNNFFLKIKCSV